MSGIPREAWDPNLKEDEKQVESQGRLEIQTQKKKRREWNPKGGLGSQLKRRRETVESQGRLGIQTQKKKRNEWNPKGGLGSKLKRRQEHIPGRKPHTPPHICRRPNGNCHPSPVMVQRGGGRPQPGLEDDMVMSELEEER